MDETLNNTRFLQQVSQAAYSADCDQAASQFFTQAVHIHLNGIEIDGLTAFAQVIDQLILADDTAGTHGKQFENRQLARRQFDGMTIDGDASSG